MSGSRRKGSARSRAQVKRKAQKRRRKRQILGSLALTFLLLLLLAFSFFVMEQEERVPEASAESFRQISRTMSKHHFAKATPLIGEEYPLEDLHAGERSVGEERGGVSERNRVKSNGTTVSLRKHEVRREKPLLVIIIDDISRASQLREVRSLPYHLTPSIFPPSQINTRSHLLARNLKHYLVHLPLESGNKKMNRFSGTLMVDDGPAAIRKRVKELRRLFPDARFVNNHTGSIFTSNYGAMYHLYGDLRSAGFIFLDSRTTGKSVVSRVVREQRGVYLARDVFLDNIRKRSAILKQLRRAVKIAEKRGYAIAIAHPHRATFDALRHAESLLSRVETVYLDELYRRRFSR